MKHAVTINGQQRDIDIRPIESSDLDRVAGVCWENRETQIRLLELQEILGLAAWDRSLCVGQLHCYRVTLPQWDDESFPGYGRARPVSWPLGWPLLAAREKGLRFDGPIWGHACFHVGFTGPDAGHADRAYFGRGIGSAMCRASVRWASEHGYSAVLAQGGTKAAPEYNVWMGCLPWTTYARMGFACAAQEEDGQQLPWWAKGEASPEAMKQVQEAVDGGTAVADLCARLMVLDLRCGAKVGTEVDFTGA
jgi:GNAT superfamily N-acetyltransferase